MLRIYYIVLYVFHAVVCVYNTFYNEKLITSLDWMRLRNVWRSIWIVAEIFENLLSWTNFILRTLNELRRPSNSAPIMNESGNAKWLSISTSITFNWYRPADFDASYKVYKFDDINHRIFEIIIKWIALFRIAFPRI